VRRAAWLCASLLSLGPLRPVRAQSSHLSDLERAVPATTGDAVAYGAAGEWRALWIVPAAAPSLRGVLVGAEKNDFGGVATVLTAARVKLGLLWQLQFAESHVSDVIDADLIAQYPDLAGLAVMARFFSIDGLHTVGRTTLSAGVREEYDELLGVRASGATARGSVHLRLGQHTAVAGVVDRAVSSGLGTPADARAPFALSQGAVTQAGLLEVNAGARVGRLREREFSETALALGARLSVKNIVSLNVNAGSGRVSDGPWIWHGAVGVGVDLASLGAYFRYNFMPEGRGATRAGAVTFTRRDPTPPDTPGVAKTRH
jgi:hypothetical protein